MTNPPSSSSSSSSESSSSGSDESQTDYEVPAVRPTDEVPHFTKKGLVRGYVEGWNVPESSLKAIEDAAALELQGKGLHKFSEVSLQQSTTFPPRVSHQLNPKYVDLPEHQRFRGLEDGRSTGQILQSSRTLFQ